MSSPPVAQVFELDKDQMTEKIKSSYGSNCKEISFLPENTVIEKTIRDLLSFLSSFSVIISLSHFGRFFSD